MSTDLIVPHSGELISREDTENCVRVLAEIRELEYRLKEAKRDLTFILSSEFSRQGSKTMEVGDYKAVLQTKKDLVWDLEVLEELRALGLPEERMNALIKAEVTYNVNAFEAERIAGANPAYAEVIERARKEVPRQSYVKVEKGV